MIERVKKPNKLIVKKSFSFDKVSYIKLKTVNKIGNGAKVDSEKKYIGKFAYVFILKKSSNAIVTYKDESLDIKSNILLISKAKIQKFGKGARINCLKKYIGYQALIVIK